MAQRRGRQDLPLDSCPPLFAASFTAETPVGKRAKFVREAQGLRLYQAPNVIQLSDPNHITLKIKCR